MPLSFYFDMIPVLLAGYVLFRVSKIQKVDWSIQLARLSSVLLILCQTTWIKSYLSGFDLVTRAVDSLWTVFNIVVMLFILTIVKQKEASDETED